MSYKSTRQPFHKSFETVMMGRGRRDGVILHRTLEGEHPMVELGAYFIGPYESLLWVECLFWGRLEHGGDAIPLSVKWGLQTGEALGFTRLVSNEGMKRLAAWSILAKVERRERLACSDPECAGGGPPCIEHVRL